MSNPYLDDPDWVERRLDIKYGISEDDSDEESEEEE